MTFSKKMMVVAAAGALTAATAVPAMAFENEFHGMFRVFGYMSNFYDGAPGFPTKPKADADVTKNIVGNFKNDARTRTFMEQRARLMYIAKANDDLKLVTHFEIDSRWGDASSTNGRNLGGALDADTVNLETKNVYLDFNIPSTPVNMKVGIQPLTDSYKGVFVNADAAGALASAKLGKATAALGYYRFYDNNNTAAGAGANQVVAGRQNQDLMIVDGKYAVNDQLKLGASYYALLNYRNFGTGTAAQDYNIHMIGLNAEGKIGPATLSGFVAYQTGDISGTNDNLSAVAANVAARVKAGPGTVKTSFLYLSGDDKNNGNNAFQTVAQNDNTKGLFRGTATNTFYEADMMLLLRNKWNINSDRALVHSLNNFNQGVIGGFVGYDATITPKVFASVNAGFLGVDKINPESPYRATSRSHYLGTELNGEVGYKMYDNLTASLQGGYAWLGGYYENGVAGETPDNPWVGRIMLNYAF